MRYRLGLFTAALALLGAGSASAQTRVITGKVTDSLTNEVIQGVADAVKQRCTGILVAPWVKNVRIVDGALQYMWLKPGVESIYIAKH